MAKQPIKLLDAHGLHLHATIDPTKMPHVDELENVLKTITERLNEAIKRINELEKGDNQSS